MYDCVGHKCSQSVGFISTVGSLSSSTAGQPEVVCGPREAAIPQASDSALSELLTEGGRGASIQL